MILAALRSLTCVRGFRGSGLNRILDMGCGVGHSTLPFCEAYPRAVVQAIDVSAPLLRYGHARAEALGKALHFSQQNAECTDFPAGFFDLIIGVAMLHETSNKAARNILAECFRLLAPGGLCLQYEGQPWNRMSTFDAAVHDWDTHFNAEPFYRKAARSGSGKAHGRGRVRGRELYRRVCYERVCRERLQRRGWNRSRKGGRDVVLWCDEVAAARSASRKGGP